MTRPPVAVFAYNRPVHLKATLEALRNNNGTDESSLYIFSDGPKQYATQDEAATYAKHAAGINFEGQTRYVLTTRNDGTLTWNG